MSKHAYVKACPKEFRDKVVQLVQVSQRSVREVAEEFAISTNSVRRLAEALSHVRTSHKPPQGGVKGGRAVRR